MVANAPKDARPTERERVVKRGLAMYARAGSFHGVSINNITDEATGTQRSNKTVRGKPGLVISVVELAVTNLWAEVDKALPEEETGRAAATPGKTRIPRGVDELFDTFAAGLHDEQTVIVMAMVELPAAARELAAWEIKGRGLQAARAAADGYDARLIERLALVLRAAGFSNAGQRAQSVAGLVRAAHLAVARARPGDVDRYQSLAAGLLSEHP